PWVTDAGERDLEGDLLGPGAAAVLGRQDAATEAGRVAPLRIDEGVVFQSEAVVVGRRGQRDAVRGPGLAAVAGPVDAILLARVARPLVEELQGLDVEP